MRASPDWSRDGRFDTSTFLGREALAQRRDHLEMQAWAQTNRERRMSAWLRYVFVAPDSPPDKIMLRPRLRTSLTLGLLLLTAFIGAVYL